MIEVRALVKTYGSKRAVDGVSFTVKRGDILGFLRPDSGTALVDGIDVQEDPVAVKRKLGYLPENAPAYPEMTVSEFLGFIAEVRGFREPLARAAHVERAISLTHLSG